MTRCALTKKELAISGIVLASFLVLTGEMYLGSDAGFLFGSLWVVQAVVHLWTSRRQEPAE